MVWSRSDTSTKRGFLMALSVSSTFVGMLKVDLRLLVLCDGCSVDGSTVLMFEMMHDAAVASMIRAGDQPYRQRW
jgi:hypothetical protein